MERTASRDPHRGVTQGTHTEGTHTEGTHTGDPRDPNRGPTQREGPTQDPHRTHTDNIRIYTFMYRSAQGVRVRVRGLTLYILCHIYDTYMDNGGVWGGGLAV